MLICAIKILNIIIIIINIIITIIIIIIIFIIITEDLLRAFKNGLTVSTP